MGIEINMERKRLWLIIFVVILAISLAGDFLLRKPEGHGESEWFHLPGLFIMMGFIGCLVLTGVAKLIGHYWLEKREDYYDRHDRDE